jgi:hypothetical protein
LKNGFAVKATGRARWRLIAKTASSRKMLAEPGT